ncbi:glycosyltransferase family 2 protein [Pedobacter nyackensis]|uniref:Glycosyltransferase involved in cell wall bisynthesis n=1 Tax=Pedobacter nyackensis TaxID=475255 RepID=A0A1W2BIV4_9SPHI|nr:glycosyltransferase family 2 protein [Pedobacter nyackensis]SMC72801.1 Glycosyltransferase involved in cell wall bisynthesis [Pedobacter nyackensis]
MGSNDLKISIITINYNNAKGLEETINSVVCQTYKNIEYLVIDGGSDDGSAEVIKRYSNGINYWVSEPDKGIYNAMNKGIRAATGDYLLFINSGDILTQKGIMDQVIQLGLDKDLVYGDIVFVKDGQRKEWPSATQLSFDTFRTAGLPHPCTFIKRVLFDEVGLYNEAHVIVSDWEFFLLATCKYNASYKHIHLFICDFCEEGISSDPLNQALIQEERNSVLEQHFSFFIKDYEAYDLMKRELNKVMFFVKVKRFFRKLKQK